jgi:hypothetical protein
MTVRQLLTNMDAVELMEWRAYFKIEKEEFDKKNNPKPDPVSVLQKMKAGMRGKPNNAGKMVRK